MMNRQKTPLLLIATVMLSMSNLPTRAEWRSGEDPAHLTKAQQLGKIHSPMPKTKLLAASDSLFEIQRDAKIGDEVMGRVNLANNSFEKAAFSIIGGSGASVFKIETYANTRGKHFGRIKRAGPLDAASYTLKVRAEFADGITDEQTYTIAVVDEPLGDRFFNFVMDSVGKQGRLKNTATDEEVREWLGKMEPNGAFSDLPFGMKKEGWKHTCEGGARLLAFVMAYLNPESDFHNDAELKAKLYRGVVANARQNALYRTNWADTHVWRNSDSIAGIGVRFIDILLKEMEREIGKKERPATAAYDAILDVCDVMWAERMHERPAIGNANRNHRMRSLLTRAALSLDPNRALTDQEIWYDTVDPRIPGYYPDGAPGDVMELIETGYVMMDTYNNRNGFFPDGTICHHPAVGIQFTADAYGWPWLVENSIPVATILKNTRYRPGNKMFNTIADRLLDAYRPLTFNGYLDMSVGGLCPDRSKWGPRLLEAVTGLLAAKSSDTVIQRETELRAFQAVLEKEGFVDELTLNQPFWNIDYLVHRRPNYLASAKMISTRSRGLERGVKKRSYYYLGDGALFVRVNADDYNGLDSVYDWHSIPGTTAEQRNDELPLDARSPFPGANGTNPFAGVVSDGVNGFGAFVYERNHADERALYSTVNANKGYFFFEDQILALGNRVRRVRPGDGNAIRTTLEQKAWTGDIVYSVGGKRETVRVNGLDVVREFNVTKPAWFHHDGVGYVVLPESGAATVELKARGKQLKLFQLSINHGENPRNDSYRYVVLPGASIDAVERFAAAPSIRVIRNDAKAIAAWSADLKMLAFYEPGLVSIDTGAEQPLKVTVDRPALVMLQTADGQMAVTVTDPLHSTANTTIKVAVNRKLSGDGCAYDSAMGVSTLSITHSAEEVYAGKPVSQTFKID